MKIFCQNTDNGLVPIYPSDFNEKKKLKKDQVYVATIVEARNYEFLKKFMALCKLGCENSKNVEMPFDTYRKYATIKAGFANVYKTPKGTFVEAQSIAFENMDEDKFQDVYSRVLDFIIKDVDSNKADIERNLMNFY